MELIKVFIPDIQIKDVNKKLLFIVTRPFLSENGWSNATREREKWGLPREWVYVSSIKDAHIVFIPLPVNIYFENGLQNQLKDIDQQCSALGMRAMAYISGDFGIAYPEFPNIWYYRMGGFKHQLSGNNYGLPVSISDRFLDVYKLKKGEKPVIGFCGHATASWKKAILESAKCIQENVRRFMINPNRKDWESVFPSAYHRAKILQLFEKSDLLVPNFIYRKKYRAGVKTVEDRDRTAKEYFQNIEESDYVVCIRGGGNFSVRLYETLMMGRIPILINTDCLMPFENEIEWKKHVIWVEWHGRKQVVNRVLEFHKQLSDDEFIQLQSKNRQLWVEKLSTKGILEVLTKSISAE